MKKHRSIHALLPIALICAAGCSSTLRAAKADGQQAAIAKTAEAFVDAFHKGDAKALAEFWTPDGDYVDENGRVLKGRKAIEDSFAELFAAKKGLKLRIDVASQQFPAPDLAIEDGTSTVIAPDGTAPSRARYTNVLVKQDDGKWLLTSVRESAYTDPSNYERLRALDWVIGEWVDEGADGPAGHISFEWAPGQNFILSTRAVEFKDAILHNGRQIIGWDPVAKQIRSWSFEEDGGFGESVWTKDGANWVIKTNATLADGSKVNATNIVTPVDANKVTWQSQDQTVNGKPLPGTKEIKMKRVQ